MTEKAHFSLYELLFAVDIYYNKGGKMGWQSRLPKKENERKDYEGPFKRPDIKGMKKSQIPWTQIMYKFNQAKSKKMKCMILLPEEHEELEEKIKEIIDETFSYTPDQTNMTIQYPFLLIQLKNQKAASKEAIEEMKAHLDILYMDEFMPGYKRSPTSDPNFCIVDIHATKENKNFFEDHKAFYFEGNDIQLANFITLYEQQYKINN